VRSTHLCVLSLINALIHSIASQRIYLSRTGLAHITDERQLTEKEVKHAFRKQALKWHPDRCVACGT
jgi:hypothetical protein